MKNKLLSQSSDNNDSESSSDHSFDENDISNEKDTYFQVEG